MKRLLFLLFIILSLMVSDIFAHSYVDRTIPTDEEIIQESIDTIELWFNAGIEEHTTIEVIHESGKVISLIDKEVSSPHFIGYLDPLTVNGEYVVKWQALGSDGHITDGDFHFFIEGLVEEETLDEVEIVEEHAQEEATNEDLEEAVEIEMDDNNSFSERLSFSTVIVIVMMMIISFTLFYILKRNNRK